MYGPGTEVISLYTNMFKGVLALFLLEMGLIASNALAGINFGQIRVILFALLMPSVLAWFGILVGHLLGLPKGSILVLAALTASASYIAAPVAIRGAVPKADIGLVMLASLGVTFPFNVIVGIPLYHAWVFFNIYIDWVGWVSFSVTQRFMLLFGSGLFFNWTYKLILFRLLLTPRS
jgi:hypothetical protein